MFCSQIFLCQFVACAPSDFEARLSVAFLDGCLIGVLEGSGTIHVVYRGK